MNLVSKNCVEFVKRFEGFSATPYNDCVGVRTLGYGMTGAEIANLTYITEERASQMLEDWMNNNYAAPIKNDLDSKGVSLTQNQFDALVSMAYNIGVGGLLGSTLYKNVVAGVREQATITENFQRWSNAGGQRLEGLYRRRTEEAAMFFRNDNNLEKVEEEDNMTPNLVVYDFNNTVDGAFARKIMKAFEWTAFDSEIPAHYNMIAKNIFCVGAPGKLPFTGHATKILQGADRWETEKIVDEFIANGGK